MFFLFFLLVSALLIHFEKGHLPFTCILNEALLLEGGKLMITFIEMTSFHTVMISERFGGPHYFSAKIAGILDSFDVLLNVLTQVASLDRTKLAHLAGP